MSPHHVPFAHSFRQRLHAGRAIRLAWLSLGSVALAELAAQARPDAIVIDLQHGLWERQALESAVGLAGAQVPVVVRCADLSPMALSTALDAGASAVMAPLVESAEQARALVRAGRYPPQGARSGGGVRPLRGGMAGMLATGREVALGAMIETQAGVEQADAICAVEGLDFIFIGTGDLALSMPQATPAQFKAACSQVREIARQRGLPCGLFTPDAAAARVALDEGYAMAVVANDIDVTARGFDRAMVESRG